jgi:recombination DNA repair RAD52 pathway protein
MTLSTKQIELLSQGLNPKRVLKAHGQSHLPAFDVIAMLDCIFGFDGWSKEILDLHQIFETLDDSGSKHKWTVCYSCTMRLTIHTERSAGTTITIDKSSDDASTGEAINQPSRADAHDLAMKSAISLALKRCAKDLGNQFGLSLYNNGSVQPLYTIPVNSGADLSTAEHPEPLSMGNDEGWEDPDLHDPDDEGEHWTTRDR